MREAYVFFFICMIHAPQNIYVITYELALMHIISGPLCPRSFTWPTYHPWGYHGMYNSLNSGNRPTLPGLLWIPWLTTPLQNYCYQPLKQASSSWTMHPSRLQHTHVLISNISKVVNIYILWLMLHIIWYSSVYYQLLQHQLLHCHSIEQFTIFLHSWDFTFRDVGA